MPKLKDHLEFVIVLILLLGATYLAAVEEDFRQVYGQICLVCLGGYFGQLVPKSGKGG